MMIHDIEPRIFYNHYQNRKARPEDRFLAYEKDAVLVREEKEKLWYPSFSDFGEAGALFMEAAQFLFTIDEVDYYLVKEKGLDRRDGWVYVPTGRFRTEQKYWRSFAGAVGWQLNRWYENHQYCSRCGKEMTP